jgi:hypothetical protein
VPASPLASDSGGVGFWLESQEENIARIFYILLLYLKSKE